MDLSVVIPCFNAEETIADQLEALARQEYSGEWEVVVADNGSSDDMARVVECYRRRVPGLRIVDASEKRGSSHARNVGVREARGEFLLFCDADDVVADDFVAVMAAALETHDIVGCRLEETLLNEPWQVKSWPNGQKDGLLGFSPRFLPFAAGGALGVRRSVFEKVGGFDTELRVRVDNDFSWRAQLAGISIHFEPGTHVHYRYPTSYRRMFRQSLGLAEGEVLLYTRYRPHGLPRLSWKRALLGRFRWSRLLLRLLRWPAMDRVERARFVRDSAYKLGRLRGSVRHRTLAL